MVVKGHVVSAQVFLISRGGGPHPFLPAHQLPHCVPGFLAGISITSELLDLMKLRYSDSTGRVSFPSLPYNPVHAGIKRKVGMLRQ